MHKPYILYIWIKETCFENFVCFQAIAKLSQPSCTEVALIFPMVSFRFMFEVVFIEDSSILRTHRQTNKNLSLSLSLSLSLLRTQELQEM